MENAARNRSESSKVNSRSPWRRTYCWEPTKLQPLDDKVNTPLIEAVEREDEAAVIKLLNNGADIDATDSNGWTAMHWALRHVTNQAISPSGSAKLDIPVVARLLYERGADLCIPD